MIFRLCFCVLALLAVAATELKQRATGTPLYRVQPSTPIPTNLPPPVTTPTIDPAVDRLLREAQQALAGNDAGGAAALYEMVLAREPHHPLAAGNLGFLRYQQGRLDEAANILRLAPDDGRSRALLGLILFRQERLAEAVAELRRAVELAPDNAEAHNFLGIALSATGQAVAGERAVRRALELKPGYADAHVNLALLYARQTPPHRELARFHYRQARALGAAIEPELEALLRP